MKTCTIFLDSREIFINIFEKIGDKIITHRQTYIITPYFPTYNTIIECIEQIARSKDSIHISNWKIFSRKISKEILKQVTNTTNITSENLTLQREQELICKGTLLESS